MVKLPKQETPPVPLSPGPSFFREEIEGWLRVQSPHVAIAIATRAALRVVPLFEWLRADAEEFEEFTGALFRATSLALSYGNPYVLPTLGLLESALEVIRNAEEFASKLVMKSSSEGYPAADVSARIVPQGVINAVIYALYTVKLTISPGDMSAVVRLAGSAANAASNTLAHDLHATARSAVEMDSAASEIWKSIFADIDRIKAEKAVPSEQFWWPLWSGGVPPAISESWKAMRARLSTNSHWDVWFDWYERRLSGRWSGDAYELVFATVPIDEWKKGPRAANAWIREYLPRGRGGLSLPHERKEADETLTQRAALYAFSLQGARITIAPEDAAPEDREATRDFLAEAQRKAVELQDRLTRSQADARLQATLRRLGDRLTQSPDAIRIGLVVSSLASLESDARTYGSESGRSEHAPDVIAALADLAETVRLFVGQYPRAREIVANQVALGLVESPELLERVEIAGDALVRSAEEHPALVANEVANALREPVDTRGEISSASERAKQAGLKILTGENYVRAVAEAQRLARDLTKEARGVVVRRAGQAAGVAVFASAGAALHHWLGDAGFALLFASAAYVREVNDALGKKGGGFDRLLKTIEAMKQLSPAVMGEHSHNDKGAKRKTRASAKKRASRRVSKKAASKPK